MIWHINIVFFRRRVLGDLVGCLKVWQMQSDVNVDGCQTWELGAKNYDSHSVFMCVEFFLGWALKGFTQARVLSLSIRGDVRIDVVI